MKILIDIPKEFEVDYNTDRFAEFFHRCLADMGTCCGNYELETSEMMEKAFTESKIYDPDKVVEQLESLKTINVDIGFGTIVSTLRKDVVVELVKAGGINDNSN